MKQYSVIIIGAGNRGWSYSSVIGSMPEKFKIVGVADPLRDRLETFKEAFGLPEEALYTDWQEILNKPKMADLAIISTMDEMHYEPALKAIDMGYHLLLEKPVAQTVQQCVDIALAAQKKGVSVLVCHVLRYTPFFKKVKEVLDEGMLGDIMSITHVEGVGHLHQSHSFVRGNWHSEKDTTPMIVAKCCHDVDIIQWLIDKPCKKVSSFGELTHFTRANAPEGAPVRCADGTCPVRDTCAYNCLKLYYEDKENAWFRDASTKGIRKGTITTDEEVMEALRTTDYGLCVYHANNDVVDHQIVNMEFEGGVNASLNMNAFNEGGRFIRIFGTKGELTAYAAADTMDIFEFQSNKHHTISLPKVEESILGGHGGGDNGIMVDLYEFLNGTYTGNSIADIRTSVNNHLIGFAAEEARNTDTVVNMDRFFEKYHMENW